MLTSSCSTFAVAAATVDGHKITEAEVESELDRVRNDPTFQELLQRQADELRGVARRNILTGLIRQKVLEVEAERLGIRVTREQVERLVAQEARRQGLSVAEFQRSQNLSDDDVRAIGERVVRLFELRRRVIADVEVDDEDVRRAYEAQRDAFVEVHVLRMTLRTEAEARRALEDLEDTGFEAIARRRSTDGLAGEGGDMGYVPITRLSSEAQTAIEQVSEGGVTDPIRGSSGFEIYRLVDRRPRDFEDVEPELRRQLADQERERRFEEWLARRLRSASIVVNPRYGRFDAQALQVVPGSGRLDP